MASADVMSESSLDRSLQLQTLQEIGELRQQIGVLQAQAIHIIKTQSEDGVKREAIYQRLGELEHLAHRMRDIIPLVEKHEETHQRGIGMLWLIRTGWIVLAALVGALASRFLR